jgi:hypothetical protein
MLLTKKLQKYCMLIEDVLTHKSSGHITSLHCLQIRFIDGRQEEYKGGVASSGKTFISSFMIFRLLVHTSLRGQLYTDM